MIEKLDADGVIAQIAKNQEAIAAERDKIDDLITDMKELRQSCRDALEDLESARDALSRLV